MPRYVDSDVYKAKLLEKEEEAINLQKEGVKEANIDKMIKAEYTIEAFVESIFALNDTPTADVRENVHGEWIKVYDKWGDIVTTVEGYKCSICDYFNTDNDNYCPNCGAKMDGE